MSAGPHGRDEVRTIARAMLTLDHRPTAVFAASGTQTMGVMDAARCLCVDIPAALSFVGFDDVEMSTTAGPTTVRQPLEESGRRAAEILIEAIVSPDREVVCEQLSLDVGARETTGSSWERQPRKERNSVRRRIKWVISTVGLRLVAAARSSGDGGLSLSRLSK